MASDAARVAAEFADAAASISNEIGRAAAELAHEIEEEWEQSAPVGPSGRTSADPSNIVEPAGTPGRPGAQVSNTHFVAYFLQGGTSKMSPKYDFFGAAEPYVEKWPDAAADAADL